MKPSNNVTVNDQTMNEKKNNMVRLLPKLQVWLYSLQIEKDSFTSS